MDLGRTQFLSLCTKAVTMGLGLVQSFIVVRIFSTAEYGVVGLVMSIGGLIGVSQHLGIVDGAIREIAVLKNPREIAKVFWVSHLVRQAVTIPLSLGLVAAAYYIAVHVYHRPEIIPLIRLFALVLILQGLQDVLGAALTGMKQFVSLYIVQIVTAALNIIIFGYLTWQYGITGFFWAVIVTTLIMVTLFSVVIARYLKDNLALPTRADITLYGRRVMRVGAFMYLSRIFFVVWQRLPILVLGVVLSAEELGYLNISLTFGSRLTIIAMALSEVNLAWMSSLYASEQQRFREVITHNMQRVFVVMTMITLVLFFFTPEILHFFIPEYLPAQHIIIVMTAAFFLYALTDIGTSSIFVSANEPRSRAFIYGLMTLATALLVGYILLTNPNPLAASYAVLAGAAVAYTGMVWHAYRKFHISLLTPQLVFLLLALAASIGWFFTDPSLLSRSIVFVVLAAYIVYEAQRSQLLPATLVFWQKKPSIGAAAPLTPRIICFAGAAYSQLSWTNRQQMMSRIAQHYPVLYVEPRVWLVRFLINHWQEPKTMLSFFKRLLWIHKVSDALYIKAQWNIIPGSREIGAIGFLNHLLNRWCVLIWARWLGFLNAQTVVWIYDTEAAEYLSAFARATVLYDCVDDHAAQAGADRNPTRITQEENIILKRADLVTVTSKKLLELKQPFNPRTRLVINSGDVTLFATPPTQGVPTTAYATLQHLRHPIFGSVGALDLYKLDAELIGQAARQRPDWNFVFIGSSVVSDKNNKGIHDLAQLPNVHMLGPVPHRQVPAYVAHFDVCLIPYRVSQYNEASFPLKFWEFMATGKPVIVSGVPELKEYTHVISYIATAQELIASGEHWLKNVDTGASDRMALAGQHTWEARVDKVLRLLLATMKEKGL